MQIKYSPQATRAIDKLAWFRHITYLPVRYRSRTLPGYTHRAYRVPGFPSKRPVIWIGSTPPPHPQSSVPPSPLGSRGRHTRMWGRGLGEPIPTKGQTLWSSMYVYYNPSTTGTHKELIRNNGPQIALLRIRRAITLVSFNKAGKKSPRGFGPPGGGHWNYSPFHSAWGRKTPPLL